MVVEDDVLLAGSLRRGLCAEGYVVDVVTDGVDGLHAAPHPRTGHVVTAPPRNTHPAGDDSCRGLSYRLRWWAGGSGPGVESDGTTPDLTSRQRALRRVLKGGFS